MQDLKARLEKLLTEAAECDLIANLATDKEKQAVFRDLAEQNRAMAVRISDVIDRMSKTGQG